MISYRRIHNGLCVFKHLFVLIAVVGEKERENGTVNIRTRDNKVHGEKSIAQVKELFKELSEKRILNSEEYSVQDVTAQLSGMEVK